MDFNISLFAILVIFCVIVSAGAVCAVDGDGYAGSNYVDDSGLSDDFNYTDDGLTDRPLIDPDAGHMEGAAGEPINQTANATAPVAGNATANVAGNTTGNTTNATASHMPATGNPILILLAVTAVLGGAAVIRRK